MADILDQSKGSSAFLTDAILPKLIIESAQYGDTCMHFKFFKILFIGYM